MKGQVIPNQIPAHQTEKCMLVHKSLKAGETIPKHNHPEHNIYFIVTKGRFIVTLNEDENHELISGQALQFNGENFISAICKEDGEAFVSLTKL